MSHVGWGAGSGSNYLYQVHLELVNQSVCDDLLNINDMTEFDPDVMICAGDVENGGRDSCQVGHLHISPYFKESQNMKQKFASD